MAAKRKRRKNPKLSTTAKVVVGLGAAAGITTGVLLGRAAHRNGKDLVESSLMGFVAGGAVTALLVGIPAVIADTKTERRQLAARRGY